MSDIDLDRTLPNNPTTPRQTAERRPGADMPEQNATLAVVVARLDDLRTDMHAMREEIRKAQQNSVTRGEWALRNEHVDSRFAGHGREIADLRTDLASRRTPWPAIAGAITGIGSLLIVLMQVIR